MSAETPTITVTRGEYEALLVHRLQAIEAFCQQTLLEAYAPGERPGTLRAVIKVKGRSNEGHLLASISVTDSAVGGRYTRNLRLVPSSPYTDSSPLQLRLIS